jgi:protein gp37
MPKTSIGWCDHSINPLRARNIETRKVGHHCVKISAGCKNCYSSRMQSPFLTQLEFVATNTPKVELFFEEKAIQEVLSRRKPTRYFWCDMTDMFMDGYPDEWIDRCFATMALTPWHTHLVLTKRADRLESYLREAPPAKGLPGFREWSGALANVHDAMVKIFPIANAHALNSASAYMDKYFPEGDGFIRSWPLPNVHVGVSVGNQETADERIPLLLQTPAAKRFVSYEPALAAVDYSEWLPVKPFHFSDCACLECSENRRRFSSDGETRYLDWVIVGGESGPKARPFDIAWARQTVEQCKTAGVPCFVKQLGRVPMMLDEDWRKLADETGLVPLLHVNNRKRVPRGFVPLALGDKKGEDWDLWPSALNDLKVREFPV